MKTFQSPYPHQFDTSFCLSQRNDDIAVRVFGARTRQEAAPLILYFHGGSFNCGSIEDADYFAQALSKAAIVVCVEYPLAPAFRFPDTVEVAFEALQWTSKHAARFGADAKRIVVAGDQAGGNLAAVTAMMARDRVTYPLTGQILLTPLLDPMQASASMRATNECPCRQGWVDYLPFISDAMHPYAAPIHSLRLGKLAPALIITAELDPLRDEAEMYAAKLIAAGVPVQVRRLDKVKGNVVDPAHPRFEFVVNTVLQFIAGPA
jgi:acetyl esterase/lipase